MSASVRREAKMTRGARLTDLSLAVRDFFETVRHLAITIVSHSHPDGLDVRIPTIMDIKSSSYWKVFAPEISLPSSAHPDFTKQVNQVFRVLKLLLTRDREI